jgi:hypothetical protein
VGGKGYDDEGDDYGVIGGGGCISQSGGRCSGHREMLSVVFLL